MFSVGFDKADRPLGAYGSSENEKSSSLEARPRSLAMLIFLARISCQVGLAYLLSIVICLFLTLC